MLATRITFSLIGAITTSLLGGAWVWIESADWEHEAAHDWEAGHSCLAFENFSRSYLVHRKSSALYLGWFYATGQCVEQNLDRAEYYFRESGITEPLKLASQYFISAVSFAALYEPALENQEAKYRITKALEHAKELGLTSEQAFSSEGIAQQLRPEEIKFFKAVLN